MTDKQVIEKKKIGDVTEVAKLMGTTTQNINNILRRPKAKRYSKVISALKAIIDARENACKSVKAHLEAAE